MATEIERRVAERLKALVAEGDTGPITLTETRERGLPGEDRTVSRLRLDEAAGAQLSLETPGRPAERRGLVDTGELVTLYAEIAKGLDSLVPRSEARFPPDMPVGMITLEIDGERADFFFPLNPARQAALGMDLPPEMRGALGRMAQISRRLAGTD